MSWADRTPPMDYDALPRLERSLRLVGHYTDEYRAGMAEAKRVSGDVAKRAACPYPPGEQAEAWLLGWRDEADSPWHRAARAAQEATEEQPALAGALT